MERGANGVPRTAAATLALIGDLKQMHWRWLRGLSFLGYGATLKVGLGIPIPILSEEIMSYCAVEDGEIYAPVVDFSRGYPYKEGGDLGLVSYAELKSGSIKIRDRRVPAAPLSSYVGAREIAATLKKWILAGEFTLSPPVAPLPSVEAGIKLQSLPQRDPSPGGM